jgi:transcriptional regulator with XRE-family HTH domain
VEPTSARYSCVKSNSPLRDARIARGLSLRQLAQRAGISHTAIRLAESADPSTVSVRVRCAIARGLGLPPSSLVPAPERAALAQAAISEADRAIAMIDGVLLDETDLETRAPETHAAIQRLRGIVAQVRGYVVQLAPATATH